jgi:gas vesicle protein
MACSIMKVTIGMIVGLAVGITASLCYEESSKGEGSRKFRKKSKDTFDTVMDAAGNFQEKTESVKDDIKSGYHEVKQNVEDAIDKVSDLYGETPD